MQTTRENAAVFHILPGYLSFFGAAANTIFCNAPSVRYFCLSVRAFVSEEEDGDRASSGVGSDDGPDVADPYP